MTKKKKIIIAILAVLLLLAGARYAQKSYQKHQVFSNGDFLSAEEKIYGLSVIWDTAKTYYGMWSLVPDLDWDAEYQAAIGRVLETDNLYAYYNELSAFAALLRDGHTQLGCLDKDFQTALRTGRGFWVSPISLRYMEGAFVLGGAPRSTLAKIPLGSTVTEINGLPTGEYLEQEYGRYLGCFTHGRREEKLAEKMLLREAAKELTVSGLTPDGAAFNVTLSYAEYAEKREQLPDDLSMELKRDVTAHDSFRSYVVADTIYVAEITSFANPALPEEFAAWIDETREKATAYILDVRGNSGGSDGNAFAVLRHFAAPADMGTRSVYKQYVDPTQVTNALGMKDLFEALEPGSELEQYYQGGLDMYAHRYVVPYDKCLSAPEYANETEAAEAEVPAVRLCTQPVAILTDWNCASAGDDFAVFAKGAPNVTLIGTNTAGGTGQLLLTELPGNFLFAVSTYNCVMEDGTPVCNNGVPPDVWCEQTVSDALAGQDAVLLRAIEHLEEKAGER